MAADVKIQLLDVFPNVKSVLVQSAHDQLIINRHNPESHFKEKVNKLLTYFNWGYVVSFDEYLGSLLDDDKALIALGDKESGRRESLIQDCDGLEQFLDFIEKWSS